MIPQPTTVNGSGMRFLQNASTAMFNGMPRIVPALNASRTQIRQTGTNEVHGRKTSRPLVLVDASLLYLAR